MPRNWPACSCEREARRTRTRKPCPKIPVAREEITIACFAGQGVERAWYYEEDRTFLLEFVPTAIHYEITGE